MFLVARRSEREVGDVDSTAQDLGSCTDLGSANISASISRFTPLCPGSRVKLYDYDMSNNSFVNG